MHRVAIWTFVASLAVEAASFIAVTQLAVAQATWTFFGTLPVLVVSAHLAWWRGRRRENGAALTLQRPQISRRPLGPVTPPGRNGYRKTWPATRIRPYQRRVR